MTSKAMTGYMSFPLYLIILFCSTWIKYSSHCQAWLISSTSTQKQASCQGPLRSRIATFRQLSQREEEDDGIDVRWSDMLKELDDSSEAVHPLQSLQNLKRTIKSEGSKKTLISRQFKNKESLQSSDLALNPDSLAPLDDILRNPIYNDIDEEEEDDDDIGNDSSSPLNDDDDAVFLDEETYLRYSTIDGGQEDFIFEETFDTSRAAKSSMSLGNNAMDLIMSPDAPYYSNTNNDNGNDSSVEDKEGTMADILALQQTLAQRRPPSPEEERAVFDEVIRDEQAYFEKTSSIFREGLTNKTAARTATFIRRNKQYRKNLLKELNKLEKQIQDFEMSLESETLMGDLQELNETVKEENLGSTTEPAIRPLIGESNESVVEDVGTALEVESSNEPIEEWIPVDDHSTGEVFFWNTRTGEMKVSLDDDDGV